MNNSNAINRGEIKIPVSEFFGPEVVVKTWMHKTDNGGEMLGIVILFLLWSSGGISGFTAVVLVVAIFLLKGGRK